MEIAIGIVVVLALAVVALLAMARQRSTTGRLSRETCRRDEAARRRRCSRRPRPRVTSRSPRTATTRGPGPTTPAAPSSRARLRAGRQGGEIEPADVGDGRGLRAGRPRGARGHPPAVLQPVAARRHRPRARRVRRGVARVPLAVGRRRLRRQGHRRLRRRDRGRLRQEDPVLQRGRQDLHRRLPQGRPPRRQEGRAYEPVLSGMEEGFVALYQKCVHLGLPGAVVPELAVVRVPVPRLEVQPGRREAGRARRPVASTASRSRSSGGNITVDTGIDRDRSARSAPTPPNQSPEGAPCV